MCFVRVLSGLGAAVEQGQIPNLDTLNIAIQDSAIEADTFALFEKLQKISSHKKLLTLSCRLFLMLCFI